MGVFYTANKDLILQKSTSIELAPVPPLLLHTGGACARRDARSASVVLGFTAMLLILKSGAGLLHRTFWVAEACKLRDTLVSAQPRQPGDIADFQHAAAGSTQAADTNRGHVAV